MLTNLPEITPRSGPAESLLFAASRHPASLQTCHEGGSLTSVPGAEFFSVCVRSVGESRESQYRDLG